ncbi:MAG TPA: M14 family zinc carboxypeptidase [Thermoanaerobaculia bacterium]|nr:M14 family zinc carboxypeptidase [Thermoanaerobaculia bacterium]
MNSTLSGLRIAAAGAALGLLALGGTAFAAGPTAAAVNYQDYHSFAKIEQQLQAWGKDHPKEVTLLTAGKSAGGRPIYVLRIAGPGPDPDARPAVFVGANIAGYHNAGTEAALDLIQALVAAPAGSPAAKLLLTTTFYVGPALNPDAHDAIFATPRVRRGGNAQKVDHDVDGLIGEDGPDDLNGDGVITRMRIHDAAGDWLADSTDPRVLVKADSMERRAGAYRVEIEGKDDDDDGEYNEDAAVGVWPDRNFPHAFPYTRDSGPWAGYAPEAHSLLDFLFAHKNIALAVVYGPANNLLAAPQSLGGGGDLGTQKFKVPPQAAKFLGFDPEQEYTIDQIWEVAQTLPFVKQNGITKEQLVQFLGAGAATKVDADDQAFLDKFAEGYKERLKKAGLSADRPGAQYARGGFTPWLYYQYGAMALELDVWGIPKAEKKAEAKPGEEPLTQEKVAAMSSDEFVALGKEKIEAFLKDNKVPAQFNADMVIGAMKGGQITPKGMIDRMKQMGGGGGGGTGSGAAGGKAGEAGAREREVLAWVDANAPGAFTPWAPVTLPGGIKAEVGGLDPFIELNPPMAILKPALGVHTETVLDLAGKLAQVEILSLEATDLGGGVWRVKAVAGNKGYLPSHTKQAARARAHIPVRLVIETGKGVELVTGYPAATSDRLEGTSGTLAGEWLVKAKPGSKIVVDLTSDNAGRDQKSIPAGKGA